MVGKAQTELPKNRAYKLMCPRLCKSGSTVLAGGATSGVGVAQSSSFLSILSEDALVTLLIMQLHNFGGGDPLTTHYAMMLIAVFIRHVVDCITRVFADAGLDRVFHEQRGSL